MSEVQELLKGVESRVARMVEEKDAEISRLQQENLRLHQELQQKSDQFLYFKSLLANVMHSMEGNQATSTPREPQGEPTFHNLGEAGDEAFTPLDEVIEVQSELSKSALGNRKLRDSYTRLSSSPLTNVEYIEEEEEVPVKVRSPYKYNQLKDRIGKSPHKAQKKNQLQEKYEEYLSPESRKIIRELSKLH